MSHFEPSLGQVFNGTQAWSQFDLPEYVTALFFAIKGEIERVYWNRHQHEWDGYENPGIPGIAWKLYYWGDDEAEVAAPNFTFEDVEIRWYKYPGRDMSCNKEWKPEQWVVWFDRCMATIRRTEANEDND